MPLQNRLLPTSEIVSAPGRGLFMGNRGILHDDHRQLGKARWRHRNWICCALSFKGRKRRLMAPGCYTELFFLDEAAALAAGHRPCAECRRTDYLAFLDAWQRARGERPKAPELDRILHAARLDGRAQRRFEAAAPDLPAGAFVLWDDVAHILIDDAMFRYSPEGYTAKLKRPANSVTCLTPAPIVEVLKAGYKPLLHPSAG
ncbi:hypothetical protein V8J36_10025 [Frigidibacter sp. MR17.14]|uniref:hypothetical protein n=1 Tax=Frigidibacter sp. MR17.14 TaxID=3126509 RepID=UPI003012E311